MYSYVAKHVQWDLLPIIEFKHQVKVLLSAYKLSPWSSLGFSANFYELQIQFRIQIQTRIWDTGLLTAQLYEY